MELELATSQQLIEELTSRTTVDVVVLELRDINGTPDLHTHRSVDLSVMAWILGLAVQSLPIHFLKAAGQLPDAESDTSE